MNCHDAREGFSALFHGGMGLTEWALLDAHVRQCVECRKERESVQEVVNSRQQVTPSRALLHCLSKMIDAIRLGLAILVATILFLWPREWPDNFMPRPSTGDRLSQDVRPPADRKPAEPAVVAPLAETRTPKSVSAPQPAPAAVSQPETRRVAVRPKPAETQAEIPAPLPSPDPALAQSRTAASAPTPTPESTWSREPSRLQESARSQDGVGSQNAEASDPAIDWPLKGGQETSRRSIESP
jgi:hypothetical protein